MPDPGLQAKYEQYNRQVRIRNASIASLLVIILMPARLSSGLVRLSSFAYTLFRSADRVFPRNRRSLADAQKSLPEAALPFSHPCLVSVAFVFHVPDDRLLRRCNFSLLCRP